MFKRFTVALLLLICGLTAGLVVSGRMRGTEEAAAQPPGDASNASDAGQARAAAAPAQAAPLVTAGPDFTRVAERTVSAVTNISSQQVVRRQMSPYANDPLTRLPFTKAQTCWRSGY